MKISLIPILKDNYAYLLEADDGTLAVIDPGDAPPILDVIGGRDLSYILNTHHHWDHTDGNAEIIAATGAKLVGPAAEESRIDGMDIKLRDRDVFNFAEHEIQVIETPGHTAGHICFYIPDAKAVFTADTLFSMGCGRLFEGTATDLWHSFQKLRGLPPETLVYCGHEYTIANGKFCQSVEPENEALQARMVEVKNMRRKKRPTLPSTIGQEIATNVFFAADTPGHLKELRDLKDRA